VSAEAAFQDAVLARLAADVDVQAVLGDPARVFDAAPNGAAYPYLAAGRAVSEPRDALDADLIEHRLTLHLWTRDTGRRETIVMLGIIRAVLHETDMTLDGGYELVSCRAVYADVFGAQDNRLAHGVLRIRALIQTI
jgi:hypothetical protein